MTETHQHHEGANGCLITKAETAGIIGVGERQVENLAQDGKLTKLTVGPAGYWVRFCRLEVEARVAPRVAGSQ